MYRNVELERALTAAMFIITIIITLQALALRNDLNHHERGPGLFKFSDWFASTINTHRGGEEDGAQERRDDGSRAATEDMDLRAVYEQLAHTRKNGRHPSRQPVKSITQ